MYTEPTSKQTINGKRSLNYENLRYMNLLKEPNIQLKESTQKIMAYSQIELSLYQIQKRTLCSSPSARFKAFSGFTKDAISQSNV